MNQHAFDWILIFGPTGVGKTDFVIKLAERLGNGVMVNADSGQCYAPLSIGTAKPHLENLTIPHYLFDIAEHPRDISVTQYRSALLPVLQSCSDKNQLPLITGGSGFYLTSLLFPPKESPQEINELSQDLPISWEYLNTIDPVRAAQIHRNDTYRIKRAIELWHSRGVLPCEYKPLYEPPAGKYMFVMLTRNRDELYQRINERVALMMNDGWIDEVKDLPGEWKEFLRKKKLLGYDDIVNFLDNVHNAAAYQTLIDTIAQKTRNYAKRQITFGKMLMKKIHEASPETPVLTIDLSKMDTDNAIEYLDQHMKGSQTL